MVEMEAREVSLLFIDFGVSEFSLGVWGWFMG